jgi:hypothetical protein
MTPRRRVLFGAQSFEQAQLNAFKTRVQADSGTLEAEACLKAQIKRLQELGLYDKASLIVTPNAYKASKIYSLKPTNGAGDLTFARASAQTRRNSAGVIENLANNVSALDYPVVGGCPWWNFPVARTNTILRSQELNTSPWSIAASATVDANTAVAPDGTTTAGTINLAAVSDSRLFQFFTIANNTTYTISAFFKNIALIAGQTFLFRVNNALAAPNNFVAAATIDLAAGTSIASIGGTLGTGYTGTATSTITNEGNGWFRVSLTFTVGSAGGTSSAGFQIINNQARSFYGWGMQAEIGSYASPYIPTLGTALTRVVSNPNTSGLNSFIGPQEGGWYTEFRTTNILPPNGDLIALYSSSVGSGSIVFHISNNLINVRIYHSSSNFFITTSLVLATNTTYRCAIRYKSGDFYLAINGNIFSSNQAATYTNPLTSIIFPQNIAIAGERPPMLFGVNAFFLMPPSNAEILALTT